MQLNTEIINEVLERINEFENRFDEAFKFLKEKELLETNSTYYRHHDFSYWFFGGGRTFILIGEDFHDGSTGQSEYKIAIESIFERWEDWKTCTKNEIYDLKEEKRIKEIKAQQKEIQRAEDKLNFLKEKYKNEKI